MEHLTPKRFRKPPTSKLADDNQPRPTISSSPSLHAQFSSSHLTIGAGVAIFHLATARVVVCRARSHRTQEQYYFLPKGRRDTHETANITAAQREGYEESGYWNRVLPLPFRHGQPISQPLGICPEEDGNEAESRTGNSGEGDMKQETDETEAGNKSQTAQPTDRLPLQQHHPYSREALWTQLLPLTSSHQYLLFWYAAETLSPPLEKQMTHHVSTKTHYRSPPAFPPGLTLRERIAQDETRDGRTGEVTGYYEPIRHEGTGVDEEEAQYESFLVSVEEACRLLRGGVLGDVVRKAWEAIQLRMEIEDEITAK